MLIAEYVENIALYYILVVLFFKYSGFGGFHNFFNAITVIVMLDYSSASSIKLSTPQIEYIIICMTFYTNAQNLILLWAMNMIFNYNS